MSADIRRRPEGALLRIYLAAAGVAPEAISKPLIGVVTCSTQLFSEKPDAKNLGDAAASGVDAAGGLVVRWDTQRTPDLVTWGHAESYSFAWRDQFADFVESWARQEALEGIVLVGDSHKTLAAMTMAAARINLTAVIATTGAGAWVFRPAGDFSPPKKAPPDVYELLSATLFGKRKPTINGLREAFQECRLVQDNHAAHAMDLALEALGVCLPGMATAPAGSARRHELAVQSGKRVVALAKSGHAFRSVLTPNAFSNAIHVSAALGGSIDVAIHLMAIAHEAGVPLTLDAFDRIARETPQLCRLGGVGEKAPHRLEDLDHADGVWAVLHALRTTAPATTIAGKGASELARGAEIKDSSVIAAARPAAKQSGVGVLRGNLAPKGALFLIGQTLPALWKGEGTALVFDGEEDAARALSAGKHPKNAVIVVRGQGPRGGPGLRKLRDGRTRLEQNHAGAHGRTFSGHAGRTFHQRGRSGSGDGGTVRRGAQRRRHRLGRGGALLTDSAHRYGDSRAVLALAAHEFGAQGIFGSLRAACNRRQRRRGVEIDEKRMSGIMETQKKTTTGTQTDQDKNLMSGAQIVVESLVREGATHIFGIPGGACLPLFDAFYGSKVNVVLTRHEQGATHMADGFARSTGKVGVCIATSGPGATNLVTGLATANMDSIPIVAITGQVATHLIGNDAFQEADATGVMRPVTKHNFMVKDVRDVARIMREAFHIARTGRPGPVHVDIPVDIQRAKTVFEWPEKVNIRSYKPKTEGNAKQIERAVELINQSQKPLLYVGGGAILSGASQELLALAERADIPVVHTLMANGAFPFDHPNYIGVLGMHGKYSSNTAMQHCDLLISAGARFDDRVTGNLATFSRQSKKIHIDIDPANIGKTVPVDVPVVGDVKAVLKVIAAQVAAAKHPEWRKEIQEW